jgi:hypothetical protein
MDEPLVAVEIPSVGDVRLKSWAKVVHSVDETKASGWAFDGEFIAAGGIQDVPVGSVVLVYGERGSRANPQSEACVFVANPDATVTPHSSGKGRAWARTIRDDVVRLLDEQAERPVAVRGWAPDLLLYADEALVEELRRRGYNVDET